MSVILGYGGYVELSREWPDSTAFPSSSTKVIANQAALLCKEPGFWTGQRVLLHAERGIPLIQSGDTYAECPDGHRFWGGQGVPGPATAHRSNDTGAFWNASNTTPFWEAESTTGLTKTISAYLHRDPLDRLTFYQSEVGAINQDTSARLTFSPVDYGVLTLSGYSSNAAYQSAVQQVGANCLDAGTTSETACKNLSAIPTIFETIASDPLERGWYALIACRDWALQTEPTMLDATAIGEDYGDSVKDVIRGAGSFSAFVPAASAQPQKLDARSLMRLMLMTEIGAKARARFRIQESGTTNCDGPGEALWLECDILLGQGEISVNIDDAIPYSAQFVVVRDKNGKGITPVIGTAPSDLPPAILKVFVDGVFEQGVFF